MSIHYSVAALNTFLGTPYFQARIPKGYPINLIAQKARRFRNLPSNVQELSKLSKQWFLRRNHHDPSRGLYDDEGYELHPDTGARLTDEEIDKEWGKMDPTLAKLEVKDIPRPKNGFADPDTWEPAPPKEDVEYDGPTKESLADDIKARGREYAAEYYGVSLDGVKTDEKLIEVILKKMKG